MDYWCALWFWPIEKSELLPSREEWLLELSALLEGQVHEDSSGRGRSAQPLLFPDLRRPEQLRMELESLGIVDIDMLRARLPRFVLVEEIASRQRFLHWELEFADIFADLGGFSLILGNPPWTRIEFDELGVLGDTDAMIVVRNLSAAEVSERRATLLTLSGSLRTYLTEYEGSAGTQSFLNAPVNYSLMHGIQTNLYKCFLPLAWRLGSTNGICGYLHPEGIYDDPQGGEIRTEVYPRLVYHFQFVNELRLFENDHHTKFSINLYTARPRSEISFVTIANLFSPATVDRSLEHEGGGFAPGVKNDEGHWSVAGHSDRVVKISPIELTVFAALYDPTGTLPERARLPAVHSIPIMTALRKLAAPGLALKMIATEEQFSQLWKETDRQRDGTIKKISKFPNNIDSLILSGPHFFVANPLYKTPRKVCDHNSAYDLIDLTAATEGYLPRTNFIPACDFDEYYRRVPRLGTGSVLECWRVAFSQMLSTNGERTLQPALLPPKVAHIHTVISFASTKLQEVVLLAGWCSAVPIDFLVKTSGQGHLYGGLIESLPFAILNRPNEIIIRTLLLNCLTIYYAPLWAASYQAIFNSDDWTKRDDDRLLSSSFSLLSNRWSWFAPLRTDYARRQALVELDVLVAQELRLTLDELKTIWRVQFPVAQQYESETFYDTHGQIVFTTSKGLTNVGLERVHWNKVKDLSAGETTSRTVIDDTQSGGPRERTITYVAPFDRCDREADYEIAWAEFERRRNCAGAEAAQ
jgi:hypothetical protein